MPRDSRERDRWVAAGFMVLACLFVVTYFQIGVKNYHLGETVTANDWQYMVLHVTTQDTIALSPDDHRRAEGVWLIADILVRNTGGESHAIDLLDSEVWDDDGQTHPTALESAPYSRYAKNAPIEQMVPPRSATEIALVFDVPARARGLELVLTAADGRVQLGD